jgi:uncharacterized membrane protein
MKLLGLTIHPNLLGLLIGMGIIAFCLAISYIFQKKLFGKYRGRVSPARDNKNGRK